MDTQLTALKDKLFSGKEANQLPAIAEIVKFGEEGLQILDEFIQTRKATNTEVTWIDGKIHQVLLQSDLPRAMELALNPLSSWCRYLKVGKGDQLSTNSNFASKTRL